MDLIFTDIITAQVSSPIGRHKTSLFWLPLQLFVFIYYFDFYVNMLKNMALKNCVVIPITF